MSVSQISLSFVSDFLQPHGLQHARPPCPSPTPRVYTRSWSLNRWCHSTFSPSVVPFSSLLQSFPASGSFPMSQFFPSGGQSIGVSASPSVHPMNIQDWLPLELTGLISLQSKGLSRVFSSTTVQKHRFFGTQPSLWSKSHICTWLLEKPQLCLDGPLSAKWCLFILIHKSIRCTENCNACRQQRSTERAQFFSMRTPDCTLHNHHFKSWTI